MHNSGIQCLSIIIVTNYDYYSDYTAMLSDISILQQYLDIPNRSSDPITQTQ